MRRRMIWSRAQHERPADQPVQTLRGRNILFPQAQLDCAVGNQIVRRRTICACARSPAGLPGVRQDSRGADVQRMPKHRKCVAGDAFGSLHRCGSFLVERLGRPRSRHYPVRVRRRAPPGLVPIHVLSGMPGGPERSTRAAPRLHPAQLRCISHPAGSPDGRYLPAFISASPPDLSHPCTAEALALVPALESGELTRHAPALSPAAAIA